MTIANIDQSEAWNGYEGRHWADNPTRYDAVNRGFDRFLLAEVHDGDDVLDVGCGAGLLAKRVAHATRGTVRGIDLSAPMLATARHDPLPANLSFVQGDAQVYPFDPASHDLAVSRFGAMFFADPVAAFANIGRALRPGGRLAMVCMNVPDGDDLTSVFAAAGMPVPTGPQTTGPLSLADPGRVRDILTAAGFRDVSVDPVTAEQNWGRDPSEAADFLSAWGPIRFALRNADPATVERVRAAMATAFEPFRSDGAVCLRSGGWLVRARRAPD